MKYGNLVRKAIEKRRQQRETVRQEVLSNVFEALEELTQHVIFDEAYVFGSVTQPYKFRDQSDIDIAFANLQDKNFFFTIAFLSKRLGREVDVVQLESAGKLQHNILREGKRWSHKKLACYKPK